MSLLLAAGSASDRTATLSATLDNVTLSAAGAVALRASLSAQLDNVALSSAGVLPITAQLGATLADVTLSGAAVLPITGVLSATLDGVALESVSTVSGGGVVAPAGHPKPFGRKRIILRDGRILVAETDADYRLAVQLALQEIEPPVRPKKKPKRRVVEVSALIEPAKPKAALLDGFAERLGERIRQDQLRKLWDQYLQEEEDIEMVLLAA